MALYNDFRPEDHVDWKNEFLYIQALRHNLFIISTNLSVDATYMFRNGRSCIIAGINKKTVKKLIHGNLIAGQNPQTCDPDPPV